jgi:hypothetical protein
MLHPHIRFPGTLGAFAIVVTLVMSLVSALDPTTLNSLILGFVALLNAVAIYLQQKNAAKIAAMAQEVTVVKEHTNSINTTLQAKIESQTVEAAHMAEITAKDKQIAELTPKKEG